jgi:glycerate kinase
MPCLLLAPCSFKGSLSAPQAAAAIGRGLAGTSLKAREMPLSDGGEGLVECFLSLPGARPVRAEVSGPLPGMRVNAVYALLDGGRTAVIEMAAAAGLPLLPPGRRDPLAATTRGFGELILDAAGRGARRLVLGLGGSATVDGGAGMAAALGLRLLDDAGRLLPDGGEELGKLAHIDAAGLGTALCGVDIEVACDVDSPLLGPAGAACLFGPQKGASPEAVGLLERGLERLARCIGDDLNRNVANLAGAGAAGGLGAGLAGFLGARLRPGADLVMDALGFDAALAGCRLLVTGEGRFDAQSLRGKAPAAAVRRARRAGCPAAALVGSLGLAPAELSSAGLSRAWELRELAGEAECVERAAELLEELARRHAGEMAELAGG